MSDHPFRTHPLKCQNVRITKRQKVMILENAFCATVNLREPQPELSLHEGLPQDEGRVCHRAKKLFRVL
jgi:hypothetical protein